MTTTPIDVNEAFRDTKLAQLEASMNKDRWLQDEMDKGNLRNVGGDLYQVIGGDDRGERFRIVRNAQGKISSVLADHGLDIKADGTVAAYTAAHTWYGLAPQLPEGTSDIETVLRIAGLDFDVELMPAYDLVDGKAKVVEGVLIPRRMDTMVGLGSVGLGYVPVQNRDAFLMLQDLVDNNQLLWESAGALRGGRRIFVSARLPEDIVVDAGGVKDVVRPFVAAFNSHNGTSSFTLCVTPWRPICKNTERFAVRDALTKWTARHTRNVQNRMEEARRSLRLTHKYYENWGKESTELARAKMGPGQFDAFLDDFWQITEDASKNKLTRHENRKELLHGLFSGSETTENCRGTAYAARCAMTEYLDFLVPTRASKDELTGLAAKGRRALEGDYDDDKTRAHRKLLELVRR